ncbi:hypothetical protein [Kangiella profundi]|nr:hypothetical protein [Kangiella profundi]GGE92053.1 hypothetical protein GCM10011356_02740 [Kangiella profundi]
MMKLVYTLLLALGILTACNAENPKEIAHGKLNYDNISYQEYEYKFINNSENEKVIQRVKDYVDSDYPGYWSNLSEQEKDIWLDYALYTGAKYGYGYGTDVLGFVKVAMTAGAGFMVDDEADYELRKIMHNNNQSGFRKIDQAIDYLNKNNVPEPKPTKIEVKKVVWLSKIENKRKQIKKKPSITVSSNNSSEGSIDIDEIILDGKFRSGATGIHECGRSVNGGGRTASLYSPPPVDSVYAKWYSWNERKNIEATVRLPGKEIMERLYYFPPWYESEFHQRPHSYIIIDIRPNNKVWVKFASSLYPQSQQEIMIIGEAQGKATNEVVTKFHHYKEGEDYRLDCFEKRKSRKDEWAKWEPTVLFDDWYPGAPQNKED